MIFRKLGSVGSPAPRRPVHRGAAGVGAPEWPVAFTASAVHTASGATVARLFTASRARDISYGDGAEVAGEDFPSLPEVTANGATTLTAAAATSRSAILDCSRAPISANVFMMARRTVSVF